MPTDGIRGSCDACCLALIQIEGRSQCQLGNASNYFARVGIIAALASRVPRAARPPRGGWGQVVVQADDWDTGRVEVGAPDLLCPRLTALETTNRAAAITPTPDPSA